MHVPFISRRARRGAVAVGGEGGIGAGAGAGEGAGAGGLKGPGESESSGSGGTSTGKLSSVPLSSSSSSSGSLGKSSATAYGYGGGESIVIPPDELFARRSAGGGTRDQIFGSRTYGSGYPGITGRGVSGRGFPFWYWPVVWIDTAAESQPYLNGSEYGDAYNTSRFGGPLVEATFISNTSSPNTVFHVLSDNSTIVSVVLTLDGYNNSVTLSNNTNMTDSPLPPNIDTNLTVCLNQTIGLAVPLVDGALPSSFAARLLASTVLLGTATQLLLSLA
ncbi:hypothetical protein F5J12DRAFT_856930 [Pisolithus orientalis]|uniref:uncharacterized protein n=1 Tax=Pisolithus orientalis TaxID=936130 RepID=UPI002225395E|nr:uncharacterized protein F5J12DRAFT_856930 [Pisolithus orientalis]KAI5994575.1 hypothetical protein F5J12DRAFT_856930 [Pisolithus orientalis]